MGDLKGYRSVGVGGGSTFIFTRVGVDGSSFLTFTPNSPSQYFMCHQQMPGNPLSVQLNLCACLNSIFSSFNTPAFCLILAIHLIFIYFAFIAFQILRCSGSSSQRSNEIVLSCMTWTMELLSKAFGRVKKNC